MNPDKAEVKIRISKGVAVWQLSLGQKTYRNTCQAPEECPDLGIADALQAASVVARTEYLRQHYRLNPKDLEE